jgi:cell division protein FtsN
MRDYKEPISRVQKRSQLKRLFGIMGGMIFVFAIFIGGVKVGIQIERERVRIAQEVPSPTPSSKEKKGTDTSESKEPPPSPEERKEKMRFTFYETLTRKEGPEKKTHKETKETAQKEQPKVTEKKEETKKASPPTTKKEEATKPSAEQEIYFIQVASFKEKETAEGLRNRLAKKKYEVHVTPVQIEGLGLWYRVRLGGYATLQEAEKVQKRIAVEENIEGTRIVSHQ